MKHQIKLKKTPIKKSKIKIQVEELVPSLIDEIESAVKAHGSFSGPHEGYAVMLEELDELWDEVRKKKHDLQLMKNECIQIAAMALRFINDVCDVCKDDKPKYVRITKSMYSDLFTCRQIYEVVGWKSCTIGPDRPRVRNNFGELDTITSSEWEPAL